MGLPSCEGTLFWRGWCPFFAGVQANQPNTQKTTMLGLPDFQKPARCAFPSSAPRFSDSRPDRFARSRLRDGNDLQEAAALFRGAFASNGALREVLGCVARAESRVAAGAGSALVAGCFHRVIILAVSGGCSKSKHGVFPCNPPLRG